MIDRFATLGYTKKDAGEIIDDFMRVITEALIDGEEVMIHGFGTFYVKDIKPRETNDVRSMERITIPGFRSPKFVAGKLLKRAIKEGIYRE